MGKGKRYNGRQKLNVKKVMAVAITIIVVVAFVVGIKQILKADKATVAKKNVELNYFTLYSNGKWGVINSYGETIIEPTNGEMIIVPNKTKAIFLCTYEVNYEDGSYKTKAINEKNEQIYAEYDNIMAIQNYDKKNKSWIEENLLKVQKDGKYGIINLEGSTILPCEYESITSLKGIKNSLLVKKDGKVGIVNCNGTIVVPTQYADVTSVTEDYKNGYIVKNDAGKFGVIKVDGQEALPCEYEEIRNVVDGNKYIAKRDGVWKILADDGKVYLEGKAENIISINNAMATVKNGEKIGIINIEGTEVIPAEYESLVYMFDDKYIAAKDGKYGVITASNEIVVEMKYTDINYNIETDYIKAKNESGNYDYMTRNFAVKLTAGDEIILDNGFIEIPDNNEIKYYNFKLEEKSNKDVYTANSLFIIKKDGKYGFIDKDGNVVVEPIYDDAKEQNDYGYVAVKKDGKWGAIDQNGTIVVEPKYTLTNNTVIDFIGKWHISEDYNASYYTDAE